MQPAITPYITLDFRKGRIRIYRSTLKMIDCPDYIRLLVNPERQVIAVQASDVNEARALRSAGIRIDSQKDFYLNSRSLTDQLRSCWRWEARKSYRLSGRVIKGKDVVTFDFESSVCVSPLDEPGNITAEQLGAYHEMPISTGH